MERLGGLDCKRQIAPACRRVDWVADG